MAGYVVDAAKVVSAVSFALQIAGSVVCSFRMLQDAVHVYDSLTAW